MQLLKNDIEFIKNNKLQFISFKYLGDNGCIQQIDIASNNIEQIDTFLDRSECVLKPIDGKKFIDPFRSFPTASFFCENIASKNNYRQLAIKLFNEAQQTTISSLMAEISFWIIDDSCATKNNDGAYSIDKHANLRSDIVATLEGINIKTGSCCQDSYSGASIISVKGKNIIDLSDNLIITKFIIANMADSYGLRAKFKYPDNNISNIALLLSTNDKKYIDILLGKKQTNIEDIKIKTTHLYKNSLEMKLVCSDAFIPYIALTKLLNSD